MSIDILQDKLLPASVANLIRESTIASSVITAKPDSVDTNSIAVTESGNVNKYYDKVVEFIKSDYHKIWWIVVIVTKFICTIFMSYLSPRNKIKYKNIDLLISLLCLFIIFAYPEYFKFIHLSNTDDNINNKSEHFSQSVKKQAFKKNIEIY